MYELVFGCQQPKTKAFIKHCCNVIFPKIRQHLTNKMKKDHQQAITGRDKQIQALEFTNQEHQQKILRLNEEINDLIANSHVAHREYFDNLHLFHQKA